MRKVNTTRFLVSAAAAIAFVVCVYARPAVAQVQFGGDFLLRAYSMKYHEALDERDDLNYLRLLGRIYMYAPVGQNASMRTDFVTLSDNPVFPVRSVAGTGTFRYAIAQMYGEYLAPEFLFFDLARFRVGRQQYRIGEGLTLGESYYLTEGWDGVRADFAFGKWTFGLFGSIVGQNLSEDGFYPRPGSDQMYVAKLEYELYDHTLLAYSLYDKRRGEYNDNMVNGFGSTGRIHWRTLQYFLEVAHQESNTPEGLPERSGAGYMAGLSYSRPAGPFRIVKGEIRHAGYQGDDATTERFEGFSPIFPSWWWGDSTGFANGSVGGNWPNRGRRSEGSRIWFGRFYVSPKAWPKTRWELHYVAVSDWVDNDGYNENDDELALKLFYQVNDNLRLQGRYVRRIPNGEDRDLSEDGIISRIEDRVDIDRFMLEFRLRF